MENKYTIYNLFMMLNLIKNPKAPIKCHNEIWQQQQKKHNKKVEEDVDVACWRNIV